MFHQARLFGGEQARMDCHMMCMDWLVDALAGKYAKGHDRRMYLHANGGGPNGTQGEGQDALHWWER